MSDTGRTRRRPSRVVRSAFTQSWFFAADRLRLQGEQRRFRLLTPSLRDRVSVPIATYDRIDVLVERTIPALLAQTHRDVEVIVVGDGTPPKLFARLADIDDPRVIRLRLPERTRYPSDPLERWMVAGWHPRNVGASMASGGWLLWMSDDDLILPEASRPFWALPGPFRQRTSSQEALRSVSTHCGSISPVRSRRVFPSRSPACPRCSPASTRGPSAGAGAAICGPSTDRLTTTS